MEIEKLKLLNIHDLDLNTKAWNCLMRYAWRHDIASSPEELTLDKISNFTYKEILSIRAIGKHTANEIVAKCYKLGIEIKGCDVKAIFDEYNGLAPKENKMQSMAAGRRRISASIELFTQKYGKRKTLDLLLAEIKNLIN